MAVTVLYKKRLLELLVQHGRQILMRRILLIVLPNGDWRDRRHVQYYLAVGPDAVTDPETISQMLADGVTSALSFAQPRVYPQSRWIGAHMSIDELGIMEGCHGLLSRTMVRFSLACGDGHKRM